MLSICIPTYNRARFLDYLLGYIDSSEIKFQFEIVISDNASTDNTKEVVDKYVNLPVRCFRQKENLGAGKNIEFAQSKALYPYTMYLADDDLPDFEGIQEAITLLDDNPDVGILYAPWLINNHPWFHIPDDIYINRNDHFALIRSILDYHIFPEIYIFRTDIMKVLKPESVNSVAFGYFTAIAEWLSLTDVLITKKPFYISVVNHPSGERKQAGYDQVETFWDSYRGGLEVILGYARYQMGSGQIAHCLREINNFIAERMQIALKLRIANKRDSAENRYLAARLRGLGN